MAHLVLCELLDANLPRLPSYSPFCVKVHRALALAGLPYERRHASRPDAYRALNPAGQVPVLLVDGEPFADSTRIVSKVEQLAPGCLSRGLDVRGRAEAFLWEEMADTVLNGFLVAARWIDDDNWPLTRATYFADMPPLLRAFLPALLRAKVRRRLVAGDVIRPDLATCWSRFEETLDRLDERAPSSGYWLGDAPSRADVAIYAQLWSLRSPLTPAAAGRLARRGRLSSWLDRVDADCPLGAGQEDRGRAGSFGSPADSRMAIAFG